MEVFTALLTKYDRNTSTKTLFERKVKKKDARRFFSVLEEAKNN